MGQIYDRFGSLTFHNEAEVSQNFLIPFLTHYLGYRLDEVLPEHLYPSFDIPQNRTRSINSRSLPPKAKPDFVVALDGRKPVAVCDTKDPTEKLDNHLKQVIAYCIALGTNMLVITNGVEFRVYFANTLVIKALDIKEIDLLFPHIYALLSKESALNLSELERIRSIGPAQLLVNGINLSQDERQRDIALTTSDYHTYLEDVVQNHTRIELPYSLQHAFDVALQRFPARELYRVAIYDTGDFMHRSDQPVSYIIALNSASHLPVLLIGESGIGKTSLLEQALVDQARLCLSRDSVIVPIFVKLGLYRHGRSLVDMILETLVSKGARVSLESVYSFLRQGKFMLLLDAFDEILDSQITSAERDMQTLMNNYKNCKIIITTRHFRMPRIFPVQRYEIQNLDDEQIRAFATMYLGINGRLFMREIVNKKLRNIASNTLLLTLLILTYLREGDLPRNRSALIKTVIERVREWSQSKQVRSEIDLDWNVKSELLSQLAYVVMSNGHSYTIDRTIAEHVIGEGIRHFQERRLIPPTITVDQTLDTLASTDFIRITHGVASYWHRVFVEYFAANSLSRKFVNDQSVVDLMTHKPEWEEIIPLSATMVDDAIELAKRVRHSNLFVAAQVLIEANVTRGAVYEEMIEELVIRANSDIQPIRHHALTLLTQMQGEYIGKVFLQLLNSPLLDVQRGALFQVAKRNLPEARSVVFSRLNWDEPSPTIWDGPSGTTVIESLSEFDDIEAQGHIVSLWRQRKDFFSSNSCRDALIRMANRTSIDDSIKQELVNLLFEDLELHKSSGIVDVLIALGDGDLAYEVASRLATMQRDEWRYFSIVKLLYSTNSAKLIEYMIERAANGDVDAEIRPMFAEALEKTISEVPLAVYARLIDSGDERVMQYGIRGLKRFRFEDVRALLLPAIHPPQHQHSLRSGHYYGHVQAAVFEVLAHFNQLGVLMERANRPQYLYDISAEVVLEEISNNRLYELVTLIDAWAENMPDHEISLHIAFALARLGHTERAIEIVNGVKSAPQANRMYHILIRGVHHLPEEHAISIIDETMYANNNGIIDKSTYLNSLCIEALERIGTHNAIERLAQIVLDTAVDESNIDTERAIRAIELLGVRDREEWVIQFIRDHPESGALHRALDTLGVIGSAASLPILQEHLNNHTSDRIRTTCYWAIRHIHKHLGALWYNGAEKSN